MMRTVRLIALVLALLETTAVADADLKLIVTDQDTLPGLGGPIVDLSMYWKVSPEGEVGFIAQSASLSGVYRWREGLAPVAAAIQGQAVPGGNGLVHGGFDYYSFYIDTEDGMLFEPSDATYRVGTSGTVVYHDGVATQCPDPNDGWFDISSPAYSTSGLFAAVACNGLHVGNRAPFSQVLHVGDTLPGFASSLKVATIETKAVAPNGDVIFAVTMSCDADPSVCAALPDRWGVYRLRGGSLSLLFKVGDTVPGTPSPITYIFGVSASRDGSVAAIVSWDDPAAPFGVRWGVIHINSAGTIRRAVTTGDPAPGLGTTVMNMGTLGGFPGEVQALAGGRIAIHVSLANGNTAMLRWSPSGTETVWAVGQPLRGTTSVVGTVNSVLVTQSGQVMLMHSFDQLYRERPDGTFEKLLEEGDVLDLGLAAPFYVSGVAIDAAFGTSADGRGSAFIDEAGGFVVRMVGTIGPNGVFAEALVYVGGGRVVNSQADLPLLAGATSCETGRSIADGRPECTLRAAIELANSRGRETTITFDLPATGPILIETALPVITVPLTIDGSGEGAVHITPASSNTTSGGLRTTAKLLLRGLAIWGFAGGGVTASTSDGIEIYASEITDNGGHGVANTNGEVRIGERGASRVLIQYNDGVGVYSTAAAPTTDRGVYATSADIRSNGQAGLASDGVISLLDVTITNNAGPGAVVLAGGPSQGISIPLVDRSLVTRVVNNGGDGLRTETATADIIIANTSEIRGNAGWGVRSRGIVRISDPLQVDKDRFVIAENGGGTTCTAYDRVNLVPTPSPVPCGGGGVLSLSDRNVVDTFLGAVHITDNQGPGVLARNGIALMQVEIARNDGSGAVLLADGAGRPGIHVNPNAGPRNIISDNAGHGIDSGRGRVLALGDSEISRNGGWGIYAEGGAVVVGTEGGPEAPRQPITIEGNGVETECIAYTLENGEPRRVDQSCPQGGGIASMWDNTAEQNMIGHVSITNNAGPGVLAAQSIALLRFTIEGNSGPGVMMGGELRETETAISVLGPGRIANNRGDGLVAWTGKIVVPFRIEVIENSGRGIAADNSRVELDLMVEDDRHTLVSLNGTGVCIAWQLLVSDTEPPRAARLDKDCPIRGGVIADTSVSGDHFDVLENVGDGVRATDEVTASHANVCHNTGLAIVAKTKSLNDVDFACGTERVDGCNTTGNEQPLVLVVVMLIVLPSRRRRP